MVILAIDDDISVVFTYSHRSCFIDWFYSLFSLASSQYFLQTKLLKAVSGIRREQRVRDCFHVKFPPDRIRCRLERAVLLLFPQLSAVQCIVIAIKEHGVCPSLELSNLFAFNFKYIYLKKKN